MESNIAEGQWKQLKGHLKEEWGKLTDDDHAKIAGNKDQLVGKLQEKYGWAKQDVESRVAAWLDKHKHASSEAH